MARDDKKDLPHGVVPVAAMFVGGVAARNLAAQGETRPQKALELAARLRRSGASPDTIHAETSKLLAGSPYAGVHYGHQASRWNPKMKPYIHGKRHKIHVAAWKPSPR